MSHEVTGLLDAAQTMYHFAEEWQHSSIPVVKTAAAQFIDVCSSTVIFQPIADAPTAVNFDIVKVENDGKYFDTLQPCFLLDVEKFSSQSSIEIQAAVALSLAQFHQFPFYGYERRLTEVVADALAVEAKFLNEMEMARVLNDPRYDDHVRIMQRLLGRPRFYSDVGFSDWKARIDVLIQDPEMIDMIGIKKFWRLCNLRQEKNVFMDMRWKYLGRKFTMKPGEISRLRKADSSERAQTVAGLMVISYLENVDPEEINIAKLN